MKNLNESAFQKNLHYKLQKAKKGLALTIASIALFSALSAPAQAATINETTKNYTASYVQVRVVDVEDRSINSGIVFPQVVEKIYEDGAYEYYLGCPKSDLIVVKYSNGTEKNIKQALKDGDISVRTLQNTYGIAIYATRKATIKSVVDNSKFYYVPQVFEKIYEDKTNEYYFSTQKSGYVTVKYSDGTEKNIKEALKDGDLTISDLYRVYGISYSTVKKATVKSVTDRSKSYRVEQAYEKIYEDNNYEYYFTTTKGKYVIVKYSDGTEKEVKQALADGDITISDLYRVYGISYVTQVRKNRISSIEDKSKESGFYVPQVMELIYSDGVNNYYFDTKKSSLVIVNYVDGTQKDIKRALRDNDLTIGDLQFTYGISVTTERVNAESRYYDQSQLYQAPDGKFWTSKEEYDEWVASQKAKEYQYK